MTGNDEVDELARLVGDRRRALIIAAAESLAQDVDADAETLGAQSVSSQTSLLVLDTLPAVTYRQNKFWRSQFAQAARALAADTRSQGVPIPRCAGEEMALHLILRRAAHAEHCLNDQLYDWPETPDEPGWGDLLECLFQDHDVLMLYDFNAQVVEVALGGGVCLDPAEWFDEFTTPYRLPERDIEPTVPYLRSPHPASGCSSEILDQLSDLDTDSECPPYKQIASVLRQAITGGEFEPGARLPSEAQLIEHFGVARMTVRAAIRSLRQDGLVHSMQGKGTFVSNQTCGPERSTAREMDMTLLDTDGSRITLTWASTDDGVPVLRIETTGRTRIAINGVEVGDPHQGWRR